MWEWTGSGKENAMDTMRQADLQSIKDFRFALLPPKLLRRDDAQNKVPELAPGKYDVQCQICGRMGTMGIDDMQRHFQSHQKTEEKTLGQTQGETT